MLDMCDQNKHVYQKSISLAVFEPRFQCGMVILVAPYLRLTA